MHNVVGERRSGLRHESHSVKSCWRVRRRAHIEIVCCGVDSVCNGEDVGEAVREISCRLQCIRFADPGLPRHANICALWRNGGNTKHRGTVGRIGAGQKFGKVTQSVAIGISAGQRWIEWVEPVLLFPAIRDAVADGTQIRIEHERTDDQITAAVDEMSAGIGDNELVDSEFSLPIIRLPTATVPLDTVIRPKPFWLGGK